MNINSRDDVLTYMIHLGYLGYNESRRTAFVPNEEIRQELTEAVESKHWNELLKFQQDSENLLDDTLDMNEDAVAAQIEKIHTDYASAIQYNYVENRIRFYVHGRKTASYDVEDITQDVYLYMSTRLSALKEPKAFWSWTDKIAAGRTNDFFDSRQGKTIASENALEIQTDADDDRNQTIAHDIVDSKSR